MQRRPWIIVVTLVLFALVFSVLVGIRYLNRSDRLRQQILSALDGVPGEIQIGNARIAATTLQLKNISYRNVEGNLTIDIDRVSVRFALGNWFLQKGGIERLIESVTIVEPEIVYRASRAKRDSLEFPNLSRLEFLKRAILRSGDFRYEDRSGRVWLELSNLDGWLRGGDARDMELQIAGSFYDDLEQRLIVNANMNLVTNEFQGEARLNGYDLSRIDLPERTMFKDLSGRLTVHTEWNWSPGAWEVGGEVDLDGGDFTIRHGPHFQHIQLRGLAENKLLTMSGSSLTEGDSTDLDLSLDYGGAMSLEMEAHIPKARLGKHLGTFTGMPEEYQPGGLVDVSTRFLWHRGEGWEWTIAGQSDLLATRVGDFQDVSTELHWDREADALKFDTLTAQWNGLDVRGSAEFAFRQEMLFKVLLQAEGAIDPSNLPDFAAPLAEKSTTGLVDIELVRGDGWTVRTQGRITDSTSTAVGEYSGVYRENRSSLRLDLYSPRLDNAWLEVARSGNSAPVVRAKNPQTLARWWRDDWTVPEDFYALDVVLQSRIESGVIRGSAFITDPRSEIKLDLFGSLFHQQDQPFTGNYGYRISRQDQQIGYGDLDFRYENKLLHVDRLEFLDAIDMSGTIDLAKHEIEKFDLLIKQLDLSSIVPGITAVPRGRVAGTLEGEVSISGAFSRPMVDSHLEFFDGRYGNLEGYWGVLTLSTNSSGEIYIQQGLLGRQNTTIVKLEGGYNVTLDAFDVRLTAPRTEANALGEAIFGHRGWIRGPIAVSGWLQGSRKLPKWTASISLVDARVMGIAFDQVDLDLRGETSPRIGHVLYIDSFEMERQRRYKFTANGAAPLTRGAGQVSAKLEGEVLAVLPQLNSFVTSADGSGVLNWTFTVVAGKLAASSGSVQVSGGKMDFQDVLPGLSDLNVSMEVGQDGHLDIKKMQANVGQNRPLIVTNEPGDRNDPKKLPIQLGELGIDIGVLHVSTPASNGIPMRLPGFSTTEDFASFKFLGRNGGKEVLISGPLDSLLFTGAVQIANARFTYPPITERATGSNGPAVSAAAAARRVPKGPTGILKLLNEARWNAEVYVAQNVRYERTVIGLEGAAFLGALSDIMSQIDLEVNIEPTQPDRPVLVTGRLVSESLRLNGEFNASDGRVEFLDLTYDIQEGELLFDPSTILPIVSGKAVTYITEQLSGGGTYSRESYLTLYVIDPVTGEKQPRGRWGEFTFVLEDQDKSSQEQVLSALGYEAGSLGQRATAIGAGGVDRAVIKRWLRPIERDIARLLGLDVVQIDPSITENLIRSNTPLEQTTQQENPQSNSPVNYLRASRVKVGKYIAPNLFLSYTGQLGGDPRYQTVEDAQTGRIGLLQSWDVEYRVRPISPNLVLQGGWQYDNVEDQSNRSLRLKYTIVYDYNRLKLSKLWRHLWN